MKDANGVTIEETYVRKGRDGWEAKTTFNVHGNRYMQIRTSKSSRGGIDSTASCVNINSDGTLTMMLFHDYHKTLLKNDVRCTDKAIKTQHDQALLLKDALLLDVGTFYLARDEDAAHEENRRMDRESLATIAPAAIVQPAVAATECVL